MSLLGFAAAGGMAGAGKGLMDIAAHKRKLEGERLRDEYLMKRLEKQQEFQAGESAKGRELTKSEDALSREHSSLLAEKGRELTRTEGALGRKHRSLLAEEGRELTRSESKKGRDLTRTEGALGRKFKAEQQKDQQEFEADQRRLVRKSRRELSSITDEAKARDLMSERLGLEVLQKRAEALAEAGIGLAKEERLEMDTLEARIKSIQDRIDHIVGFRFEQGKWPWQVKLTRADLTDWMKETGGTWEGIVNRALSLGHTIDPSDQKQFPSTPDLPARSPEEEPRRPPKDKVNLSDPRLF